MSPNKFDRFTLQICLKSLRNDLAFTNLVFHNISFPLNPFLEAALVNDGVVISEQCKFFSCHLGWTNTKNFIDTTESVVPIRYYLFSLMHDLRHPIS